MNFAFELVDDEARVFCTEIVDALVSRYGFSEDKALHLLNQRWGHAKRVGGPEEILFHDLPERWAERIYSEYKAGHLT